MENKRLFWVLSTFLMICTVADCQTETSDIMEHISADLKHGAFSETGNTWAEMREDFRRKKTLILDMYAQTSRLQKVSRADFERYNSGRVTRACSQYQWEIIRPWAYAMAVNFKDLMDYVERAPDMPPGPEKRQQFLSLKHKEEVLEAQDIHGPCGTSGVSERRPPDKQPQAASQSQPTTVNPNAQPRGDIFDQLQEEQPPEPDYGAVGDFINLEIDCAGYKLGLFSTCAEETETSFISRVRISPAFSHPTAFKVFCAKNRSDCEPLFNGAISFRLLRSGDQREYTHPSLISTSKLSGADAIASHEIYGVIDPNGVLTKWIKDKNH
ncbi:MAG: hypothetical protein WA899_02685 [Candidatus Sulfotelmatobacter sp.]|jgi:hypothetical protein